jgi:predicted transposase/invertase (TIGR01784 family)
LLYFKDLELHTIELNKFTKDSNEELSDIVAKVKTSLDMWSAFLTRNDLLNPDNLPKELNDPSLKKALNVLEVMNFNPLEREDYEDHLKWLRIEYNTLKKMKADGIAIGKAEAEAKAKIDIAEAEAKAKIDIARNLLKTGLSVDVISTSTGLSIDEIKKLTSQ